MNLSQCILENLKRKRDVGTNTDDVDFGGEINSHQTPPPVEYAEGSDQLEYYSSTGWHQSYAYYIPEHKYEWGQSYSYEAPGPEYAEWCGTYASNLPPAYPPEWSYVTPFISQTALFRATNLS
jgi:hypothetical protein